MEYIVANVDNVKFDLEEQIENQVGCQPMPFPGMDSELKNIVSIMIVMNIVIVTLATRYIL